MGASRCISTRESYKSGFIRLPGQHNGPSQVSYVRQLHTIEPCLQFLGLSTTTHVPQLHQGTDDSLVSTTDHHKLRSTAAHDRTLPSINYFLASRRPRMYPGPTKVYGTRCANLPIINFIFLTLSEEGSWRRPRCHSSQPSAWVTCHPDPVVLHLAWMPCAAASDHRPARHRERATSRSREVCFAHVHRKFILSTT